RAAGDAGVSALRGREPRARVSRVIAGVVAQTVCSIGCSKESAMRRTRPRPARATIEEIIGDPRKLDEELNQYRRDSEVLSSPDLIRQYAKRWIAIYGGKVRAETRSMEEVLE